MIRSLLLLLAVPLGSMAAQATVVRLTVTSPSQAAFRIIGPGPDSVDRPFVARGRVDFDARPYSRGGTLQGIEITALDTTAAVHVEARQNGRLIASGEGVHLTVRQDTSGIAIEARSSVPMGIARTLRKPE